MLVLREAKCKRRELSSRRGASSSLLLRHDRQRLNLKTIVRNGKVLDDTIQNLSSTRTDTSILQPNLAEKHTFLILPSHATPCSTSVTPCASKQQIYYAWAIRRAPPRISSSCLVQN